MSDKSEEYLKEGLAKLVGAAASETADEIQSKTSDTNKSGTADLQQNTLATQANTNALKALNEEKLKGITIEEQLQKIHQQSLITQNLRNGNSITPSAYIGLNDIKDKTGNITGRLNEKDSTELKNISSVLDKISENVKPEALEEGRKKLSRYDELITKAKSQLNIQNTPDYVRENAALIGMGYENYRNRHINPGAVIPVGQAYDGTRAEQQRLFEKQLNESKIAAFNNSSKDNVSRGDDLLSSLNDEYQKYLEIQSFLAKMMNDPFVKLADKATIAGVQDQLNDIGKLDPKGYGKKKDFKGEGALGDYQQSKALMEQQLEISSKMQNNKNATDENKLASAEKAEKATEVFTESTSRLLESLRNFNNDKSITGLIEKFNSAKTIANTTSLKSSDFDLSLVRGVKEFNKNSDSKISFEGDNFKSVTQGLETFSKIGSILENLREAPFATLADISRIDELQTGRSSIGRLGGFNSEGTFVNGEGLAGNYSLAKYNLSTAISSANSVLNDPEAVEEKKQDAIKKTVEANNEFIKSVEELSKALEDANKIDTKDSIGQKIKNELESKHGASRDDYDRWKLAPFRTRKMQEEMKAYYGGHLPARFGGTGNFKESFQRTLFNRSAGYRQRGGLSGFAANIGYGASGTALSIGMGAAALGVTKLTKAIWDLSKTSVEAYSQIESIKTNLGIVYGSQTEANQTFSDIAAYSIKSPFGVQTVSEYAVLLKQSGIYASDLMDTLKQIGDVAGGNQQKFANIANAFAQIEANGKATTRQLRQFATAGLPIYKELAEQLGVSVSEVRNLTENGKISASQIEKVFAKMTGEGGIFENAVNIGAKTLAARKQNLEDARQLAQSAFGEWLTSVGQTGTTDSFYRQFLSFREDFHQSMQSWFSLKNIEKNVRNIDENRSKITELTNLYNAIKDDNSVDEKVKQALRNSIKELSDRYTPDQERASLLSSYEYYKKFNNERYLLDKNQYSEVQNRYDDVAASIIDDYNKRHKNDELQYTPVINYSHGVPYLADQQSGIKLEDISKELIPVLIDLRDIIEHRISNRENKKYTDFMNKYEDKVYEGLINNSASNIVDTLNKAQNRNEVSLGLGKASNISLHNYAVKSESAYRNTTKGKEEQKLQKKIDWNNAQKKYDELSKYVDVNGSIVDNITLSLQKWNEILESGILVNTEKISLNEEDISSEYKTNLLGNKESVQKELQQRADNWALVGDNILNAANNEDIRSSLSEAGVKLLDTLVESMFEQLEDGSYKIKENNKANTNAFRKAFVEAQEKLSSGDENAKLVAKVLDTARTRSDKAKRPLDYDTANGVETLPFWQRLASSQLGISDVLFKQKAITRGDQAVQFFDKQQQKQTVQNIFKSMLSEGTLKKALYDENGNSRLRYAPGKSNSYDGTRKINWEGTYKNYQELALSAESSVKMTRALAESLNSEKETLDTFLAKAITESDDAANVYSLDYQKYLGEFSKTLEGMNMNAWDFIQKNDNGQYEWVENAPRAAEAIESLYQRSRETANAMADFKDSIKSLNAQTDELRLSTRLYTGGFDNLGMLNGMTNNEKDEFIKQVNSVLSKDENIGIRDEVLNKLSEISDTESYLAQLEEKKRESGNYNEAKNAYEDSESLKNLTWNNYSAKMKEYNLDKGEGGLLERYTSRKKFLQDKSKELADQIKSATGAGAGTIAEEKNKIDIELSKIDKNYKELLGLLDEYNKAKEANASSIAKLSETTKETIDPIEHLIEVILGLADATKKTTEETKQNEFAKAFNRRLNSGEEDAKDVRNWKNRVGSAFYKSILEGENNITAGNTLRQQMMADAGGNPGLRISEDRTFYTMLKDSNNKEFESFNISAFNELIAKIDGLSVLEKEFSMPWRRDFTTNIQDIKSVKLGDDNFLRTIQNSDTETLRALFDQDPESFKNALAEMVGLSDELNQNFGSLEYMTQTIQESWASIVTDLLKSVKEGIAKGLSNTFEILGENIHELNEGLITEDELSEKIGKNWKDVGQNILSSLGPQMISTGLTIAGQSAMAGSWEGVAAGLLMAGVGGAASFAAGMLKDDSKEDDKLKRIQALKDMLADLIDQARTDAEYYEKNLRHESALETLDVTHVNDAIITPQGKIVSTAPDDYLIATKTPGSLAGGGEVVVNFQMIDQSTGASVETRSVEKRRNPDGSVDLVAVVGAIMDKRIADGDADGAFMARETRINGSSFVM